MHLYLSSAAIFMLTALLNLLTACHPPSRPRSTRLFTLSRPYSVHLPNARINEYLHSFIPYTGKLKLSSFVCFSTCLRLKFFQKRSVQKPIMLNELNPLIYSFYCPLHCPGSQKKCPTEYPLHVSTRSNHV